jgi:DNA-directed RNA polymerase sigma subunit (sigma70/sigma32)
MAKKMGSKFKSLRKVMRLWHSQISKLAKVIDNNKVIISFLDFLEETRGLSLEEWNFRKVIQDHLERLLEQQHVYW